MIAPVQPLLGVMELDSSFTSWYDLPRLAIGWLQDAGGFAAIGLVFWFFYVLVTPSPAISGSRRQMITKFMAWTAAFALIVYLIALGLTVAVQIDEARWAEEQGLSLEQIQEQVSKGQRPPREVTTLDWAQYIALAAGGLLALVAFCEPFVLDFLRLRWRRIYAIAKLSFKEAVRRRVVWVFLIFLLVFLFPARWFFSQQVKPEDDLKTTVNVISYAMTWLFIPVALLLTGFSIPADVKSLTIHTIVTKPVERFEIVVGRFLGYMGLLTIALTFITGVSVLMIATSNIDPAAREESMKARVPIYGTLDFSKERLDREKKVERQNFTGVDVGREYSYRKYIAGGPDSTHRAIWSFLDAGDLKGLASKSSVPIEFAFDVYRTTKGEENAGVRCSFDILSWKWDPKREDEYLDRLKEQRDGTGRVTQPSLRNIRPDDKERWKLVCKVAEEFGRYQYEGVSIFDYHTYTLHIPAELFKNATSGGSPDKTSPLQSSRGPAFVQIKVNCTTESQLVGVAPLDLYILESQGMFWFNFFKGAIGLWCRLAIGMALAIAASTYLAGVVSFLTAMGLFLAGYFLNFIKSIAAGVSAGGGPFESFTRLVKGTTVAGDLDKTPTVQVALFGDDMFRWLLRRFINVIPDTERFTWSKYLAEGFSIEPAFILLNLVLMAAYLLPWFVLAYYLMRSREIAA